jgi:predicted amidophosphoribosyltransferase
MKTKKEARREEEKLWCPYCEDELAESQMPYCQPCKVETFNCPSCGKPAPRTKRICPSCGARMKPVSQGK